MLEFLPEGGAKQVDLTKNHSICERDDHYQLGAHHSYRYLMDSYLDESDESEEK